MNENAAACPQSIVDLVKRFETHHESYRRSDYKEAELRQEFIDPFFEALGWDISNKSGKSETFKDVVVEDALKIGGTTKAPDYAFRIGGARVFFVEAKKPSHDLQMDSAPACQLRRYAWNAKLALSILTDFEEFVVYDCRVKPSAKDKAVTARILYLNFKEYAARWDEISALISREAVERGSLERFRSSEKGKRGTSAVDDEFLKDIEGWRDILARNLALRNRRISELDLNTSVQRILDRIIFLRIAEDRGIERFRQLQDLLTRRNIYRELCALFQRADERYNSGLFYFHKEKGRSEPPDELTLQLKVDDAVLKEIVGHLYYPDCQYEFSVISADILGNIYEQFLGKVIRMTEGHHAKVEEKPEVRKAGGVYYTPTYIVDYIVKNTVGKLCEGKSPKEIAALRILDPACGSGSFLIGAYTFLLNYHLDWYLKDGVGGHGKEVYEVSKGKWRLTTQEKKRILLNNIYGVDIDRQAVEVTKLSLLLKVLEGENQETLERQMTLFHERALPDLASNIKCGNSLIGPDYFQGQLILDNDKMRRVNAFDWPTEFPAILRSNLPDRRRGFDAIIGNPPYRSLLLGRKRLSEEKRIVDYYEEKFPNSACHKINLFGLFMEKCHELLRSDGLFSFIIPNLFLTTHHFTSLRRHLLQSGRFRVIFDLRYKVFGGAEIGGSAIFVLGKEVSTRQTTIHLASTREEFNKPVVRMSSAVAPLKDVQHNLLSDPGQTVVEKCIAKVPCILLGEACKVYQGIITGDNDKFLSDRPRGKHWKPILRGRDIHRYYSKHNDIYVLYDPELLWSNTDPVMFQCAEKIISRQTSDHIVATYDSDGYFALDSTHVIHLRRPLFSLKYMLGIFNSRLLNYLYTGRVKEGGRVFAQVKVVNLRPLPIRSIDFSAPTDKTRHDRMVSLVDRMLELHKRLAAARNEEDKTPLQRQIASTDREIDQLVYELYALTAEEIRIVEEGVDQ